MKMKRYWGVGRHQNQPYAVERIENAGLKINDRTWKIRDFMIVYFWVKGLWPTINEIIRHTHIPRSVVWHHQNKLEEWGLLKRAPGVARSAQIVEETHEEN